MNCANHPDTPASAYCQFCGKPLCNNCVRSVGGVVYCESCLQARVSAAGAASPGYGVPLQPLPGPNPVLAALLGIIPGVGAMYNGQLVKGLAHVIIFAVLISLSHASGVFGILIPAWVFYQVFDAFQTAKARRDGLPLPNPFGLNDLGQRLGLYPNPGVPPVQPGIPPQPPTGQAYTAGGVVGGSAPGATPNATPGAAPGAGFVPPAAPPYTAAAQEPYQQVYGNVPYGAPPSGVYDPAVAPIPPATSQNAPLGAIILIGLGVLFLLATLGVLNADWMERGWPIAVIAVGIWLFIRRSREIKAREAQAATNPAPGGGLR